MLVVTAPAIALIDPAELFRSVVSGGFTGLGKFLRSIQIAEQSRRESRGFQFFFSNRLRRDGAEERVDLIASCFERGFCGCGEIVAVDGAKRLVATGGSGDRYRGRCATGM